MLRKYASIIGIALTFGLLGWVGLGLIHRIPRRDLIRSPVFQGTDYFRVVPIRCRTDRLASTEDWAFLAPSRVKRGLLYGVRIGDGSRCRISVDDSTILAVAAAAEANSLTTLSTTSRGKTFQVTHHRMDGTRARSAVIETLTTSNSRPGVDVLRGWFADDKHVTLQLRGANHWSNKRFPRPVGHEIVRVDPERLSMLTTSAVELSAGQESDRWLNVWHFSSEETPPVITRRLAISPRSPLYNLQHHGGPFFPVESTDRRRIVFLRTFDGTPITSIPGDISNDCRLNSAGRIWRLRPRAEAWNPSTGTWQSPLIRDVVTPQQSAWVRVDGLDGTRVGQVIPMGVVAPSLTSVLNSSLGCQMKVGWIGDGRLAVIDKKYGCRFRLWDSVSRQTLATVMPYRAASLALVWTGFVWTASSIGWIRFLTSSDRPRRTEAASLAATLTVVLWGTFVLNATSWSSFGLTHRTNDGFNRTLTLVLTHCAAAYGFVAGRNWITKTAPVTLAVYAGILLHPGEQRFAEFVRLGLWMLPIAVAGLSLAAETFQASVAAGRLKGPTRPLPRSLRGWVGLVSLSGIACCLALVSVRFVGPFGPAAAVRYFYPNALFGLFADAEVESFWTLLVAIVLWRLPTRIGRWAGVSSIAAVGVHLWTRLGGMLESGDATVFEWFRIEQTAHRLWISLIVVGFATAAAMPQRRSQPDDDSGDGR